MKKKTTKTSSRKTSPRGTSNANELPVKSFKTAIQWRQWLDKNHGKARGIWIKIYKKDSGVPSVDRGAALMEALCYGWIDGQAVGKDEQSYLQKYTPRRKGSIWSKRNIEYVTSLEREGRMKPAGLKQVELAKANGQWDRAYDSPRNMKIPEDFLARLARNRKAKTFFETLNKTNTFAISWRLQTAKKPETRERRMKAIIEMLARGEKFY